jgi:hypothetical protein
MAGFVIRWIGCDVANYAFEGIYPERTPALPPGSVPLSQGATRAPWVAAGAVLRAGGHTA